MENVGKNPLAKPINKKAWIIGFSVTGVVIVGLVIAIVVMLVTRGNKAFEEPIVYDTWEDEVRAKYVDDTDQISEEADDEEYSLEKLMDLYAKKIEEEEDEKARLLLEKDYYYLLSIVGSRDLKDQIMSKLIEIDNKLQMPDTAFAIVNRAKYYGDEELEREYNKIGNDRIGISEEEINALREEIEKEAMEEEKDEEK